MVKLRRIIAWMVLTAVLAGPLEPLALAQQPSQPAQPQLFQEAMKGGRTQSGTDAYDVGAGVANVVRVPAKGVLCVLGGAVGFSLLIMTFGTAYKASTRIAEEGCGGKWILTGDDLRPEKEAAAADSWEMRRSGTEQK